MSKTLLIYKIVNRKGSKFPSNLKGRETSEQRASSSKQLHQEQDSYSTAPFTIPELMIMDLSVALFLTREAV